MATDSTEPNEFVFEYYNEDDSIETVFHQLTSQLTERTSEITGFRIELTTDETFDVPFDALVGQQSGQKNTGADTRTGGTTQSGADSASSNGDATTATDIPTLQSDALPAQVLSTMLDSEADSVRTTTLTDEFDDEEIDTARLSQTLASLKRRDLVAAEPDPDDQRANLYWPTERGEQALSQ